MKNILAISLLFQICITVGVKAQLSSHDAVKAMGRGINMGNTLEPPNGEGTWGNPGVVAGNFDDYKNAGFTSVRLPITWDKHTDTLAPYAINQAWFNRIEQIVNWGLERKLLIIINCQHEDWIKNSYTVKNKVRFDSIWSQIATRFRNKSDSLLFEVINEPYPMSSMNVDELNARIIQIIRKTNPTRNVLFSGYRWSNSLELIQAAVPNDNFIIGYWHSYDPYPFGLVGTGTYGSDADIAATKKEFDDVVTWANGHKNLPTVLSEFGYIKDCEYNSRMCAYATVTEQAQIHDMPFMAWEDGGNFKFYDRTQHTWSEIKDVIINTYKESPNKMNITSYADTLIKLQWNNRTTENDSIIVERRCDSSQFAFFVKIAPTASEFIDTTTSSGNTYYYRLRTNLKDSIEIQSYPIMKRILPIYRTPFYGEPVSIPGYVECEDFDIGGEGLTYHDIDIVNKGGSSYRNDGVDIEDSGSTINIGYVAAGEWLEYTIDVQQSGTYSISALVAAVSAGGKFSLRLNKRTTTFTTVATGDWNTFSVLTNTLRLDTGVQVMRLTILNTPEFNLDYISFSYAASVASEGALMHFKLFDNYPNPFNPFTTIRYSLPHSGYVKLIVFDVLGRQVAAVVNRKQDAGVYEAPFDASLLPSGVYFYRLNIGTFAQTKKMILLK